MTPLTRHRSGSARAFSMQRRSPHFVHVSYAFYRIASTYKRIIIHQRSYSCSCAASSHCIRVSRCACARLVCMSAQPAPSCSVRKQCSPFMRRHSICTLIEECEVLSTITTSISTLRVERQRRGARTLAITHRRREQSRRQCSVLLMQPRMDADRQIDTAARCTR
jgi:hypothetical protein